MEEHKIFIPGAALVQAWFHAKTWGEIFVSYVDGNKVVFAKAKDQIRSERVISDKPLSEARMKEQGLKLVDYSSKFIQTAHNSQPMEVDVYKYDGEPSIETFLKGYTLDLESNTAIDGWPKQHSPFHSCDNLNLLLLSALLKELSTKEMKQLCALYSLKDDGLLKTYVGYKFQHNASRFILQAGV